MLKRLFTIGFLLWVLGPSASAQSAGSSNDVVFENLCAPDLQDDGLYVETGPVALDNAQLARLRIELLERGFDPGFDPAALDADEKLTAAIREFQAEFSLPVTGEADVETLWMLSVPTSQSDSGIPVSRADR